MKYKTLIIDDESLAREMIVAYLKEYNEIEIIGQCSNGFEALKQIQDLKPDLIFLDIQMPKLNGFEMLELLDIKPVIIFSTAYDQYALKAFESSATDYLLKPFSKDRFAMALHKAMTTLNGSRDPHPSEKDETLYQLESLNRIVVKHQEGIQVIPSTEIDFIESADDYVMIHHKGKKYLKNRSMQWLENALPKKQFIRIHRTIILNLSCLARIEPYTKDSWIAILKDSKRLPVSKSGYQRLKQILEE